MKIGIYGGTYNPPHLGHLAAAKAVFSLLELDRLLLIPAGTPPHKVMPAGSPTNEQRLEMTRLAAEQLDLGDRVEVLDLELHRQGKSFTSDTIAELKGQYPEDELWLLMGTDMFLTFQTWHAPEEILANAGIAAFGRTEADTEELFSIQREYLMKTYPGAKIFTLTIPGVIEISSTELREQLERGEGGAFLAPAVHGYILREGLYQTPVDLKKLTLSQLRSVAISHLKHSRIPHVLGTEEEAVRLAKRYGGDEEKIRRAALLHDCTKRLKLEDQLAICARYGLDVDEDERKSAALLHSKTAAALAKHVYGEDEEVCGAICWHTTGRADMTQLEKILYIADYIEPTRNFPGVEELRKTVYEDLDTGILMGMENTISLMQRRGEPIHANTTRARDALRERIERRGES